ncbi:hypothetical protein AVEN_116925-1 [Araneus ventricosus]|uniref:Uncharacterized protein n=1 Tax=Araneus ventricosus TaxID=182803 RepID=A0A4Y2GLT3_ARAVE|nr:hypothetical protein AVEN_116925-1 [Araneus ventricosus]
MARFVRSVRGKTNQPSRTKAQVTLRLSFWHEGETKCHCHRLPLWFRRLPDRLGEEPEVKVFRDLPRFLRGCTGVALSSCLNTFSTDAWYVPTGSFGLSGLAIT